MRIERKHLLCEQAVVLPLCEDKLCYLFFHSPAEFSRLKPPKGPSRDPVAAKSRRHLLDTHYQSAGIATGSCISRKLSRPPFALLPIPIPVAFSCWDTLSGSLLAFAPDNIAGILGSIRIRPVTGRPSLFPFSATRTAIGWPCGLPTCSETSGSGNDTGLPCSA